MKTVFQITGWRFCRILHAALAWGWACQGGNAAEASLAAAARSILESRCFECHSHAANRSKGGLILDSREAMLTGGDSGPAVVPGKPGLSLLLKAVRHEDHALKMPAKADKLPDSELATLTRWLEAGAPWPRTPDAGESATLTRRKSSAISPEDREWWAFQPLRTLPPPEVGPAMKPRNAIDRFIGARLENQGLTPAPEASRTVLIRRLTLDLTGLPPSPGEIDAFLADKSSDAYERLVDRLLASPQHGERMARSWLDLVRYADGDGYRADDYRPNAWRYRDYVVRSLNADKPYDRFVQEQLAGDELFPDDPEAIIATGYLRNGMYEWNARDVRGQWDVILNDITDTTGDVFLGMGIQCARCHDHKFDPILQRDYFRLRAFFAAIQPGDRVAATSRDVAAHEERMRAWEARTKALRDEIARLEKPYLHAGETNAVGKFPDDIQAMIRKPAGQRTPLESQLAALAWRQVVYEWDRVDRSYKGEDKERILELKRRLAAASQDKPTPLPLAFAATDVGPVAPVVTIPRKPGLGVIEPGLPEVLQPDPLRAQPSGVSTGRRAALARWLTRPDSSLTARVVVNRAWQQHFGRGLAANPSDFGLLGEKPVHPELLDWLAGWFIHEGGWSLKRLHRLLVTSAAYRRGSEHPSPHQGRLKDPDNRLLWRWTPRRLEAEQIRDAMLSVSGELDRSAGGPGAAWDIPRRTLYTRFMRNTRDPLAEVFDAPLWITSSASRDTTTTPVQSLLLANSASLRTRGRAFASRLERESPGNLAAQVRLAYRLAYGRTARAGELAAASDFIATQARMADPGRLASGQAAFVPGKLPYRDGQAAFLDPDGPQSRFTVAESSALGGDGAFTIEAFILPRTIAEGAESRTIAAKGSGERDAPGWSLGITGQKSPRRPLTLALDLVGRLADGRVAKTPVYSDLSLNVNKPYFVGAAFTPASGGSQGQVLFALKDLSNDDEPLLTAVVPHGIEGGITSTSPLTLGARSGPDAQPFHGLIDDIRLTGAALATEQMLILSESLSPSTLGYWKFEPKPDVLEDSSGHKHFLIRPSAMTVRTPTRSQAALAEFCQALLNSTEFLYTE